MAFRVAAKWRCGRVTHPPTVSGMVTITGLDEADRVAWERLFRGYLRFYRQDPAQDLFERLWASCF